ncbi:acyl-CoA dehydrogenase NM domain-like protein [Saitoella complicata NRRL Y-17804]|uniref:acyl-CoA dehydrogenase NM domain-like protein n=1 Tax=Saitoella complicata (strain BCRC 22490 / CBS 7301 / JCM 7358 / NBRC 10748 / NRRL Y-17804) TaxID=698492 RepID=UPI000866E178|nr:acyl-CoA dehydrogenase NM domain-like protein [Saitoella complicata NRRL Y-17804]ODQ52354.1 acyl-CoA dehydrogenase NM domain-like protein [Saitoella complicata NRRL Y-17804]
MEKTFGDLVPFADPPWYQAIKSPYYNESHARLRAAVRQYVEKELRPHAEEWEVEGKIPDEAFKKHAEQGFVAAAIWPLPKEDMKKLGTKLPGGVHPDEWDAFHDFICHDELMRIGYLGVNWGISTTGNVIGFPPVVEFGTHPLKSELVPQVLRGEKRFCLGVTEPDAGSDVGGITTTAEKARDGTHYLVNGAKKWITNGVFADYMTTAVRTGGPGASGISVLVVPLDTPGVTRRKIHNSGVNASGSTYVELDNVKVPVSNLLGKEGEGFKIIMSNFNHERLWLSYQANRMSRCCVEDALLHAMNRQAFGKALIEQPVIRAKLSEMGRHVAASHALLEQLVYHFSRSTRAESDADLAGLIALAKVQCTRSLEIVNREAQQVLGGLGYQRGGRGGRIEQISRDLRVMVVGGGSIEIVSDLAMKQGLNSARRKGAKI